MKTWIAAFASMMLCASGLAADWSFQPTLGWRADHYSNRRLSIEDQPSEGAWLLLDADLKRATATSEWKLQPQLTLQRFAREPQLDSNDGGLSWMGVWRDEYSELGASAKIARASSLTTELDETGIVDARVRRKDRDFGLSLNSQLAPRQQLNLQLGFADVDYPGGERSGLVGYRYPNAALGFKAQLSEHTSLNATAFGGRLNAPEIGAESRNAGLRLGFGHAFSPYTQGIVSAGLSRTRVGSFFGTRSDQSEVWSAELTHRVEHLRWNFSWERSIAASGRGVLTRRDEIATGVTRDFSTLMYGSLGLRAVQNEELAFDFRNDDRRYFAADTSLGRRLSPYWTLTLSAGLLQSRWQFIEQTARGWYGALGLRWAPAPRTLFR